MASTLFAQDSLLLEGPEKANPVEMKKAAKSLQKRCLDYGFEGVSAKLVYRGTKKVIEVSGRAELTKEMKESILRLASLAGNDLSFRQKYRLSAAQEEQFKPGERAPKGTEWIAYMGKEESSEDPFELFYTTRIGNRSDFDFSTIERGTISTDFFQNPRPFIRLSSPLSSRIKKYISGQSEHSLTFLIDKMIPSKEWDLQFDEGPIHYWYCTKKSESHSDCQKSDHKSYRKAYWFFSFDPKYLGPILKNPMPFPLTNSE